MKLIVHFSYHKCMTAYYKKIMVHLFNDKYGLCKSNIVQFYERANRGDYKALSLNNQIVDFDEIPPYVGSHFIRDPRDMLVSGYYYHLWCGEKWVTNQEFYPDQFPFLVSFRHNGTIKTEEVGVASSHDSGNNRYSLWYELVEDEIFKEYVLEHNNQVPNNISYQDYLNTLDKERGLILECLVRHVLKHFKNMNDWNYDNPNILEFKYEDILNNETAVFTEIFKRYGLSRRLTKKGLKIVEKRSIKNQARNQGSHIRKATSGQWKQEFTPRVKEVFKQLFGDVLVNLGYEKDNNW